MRTSARDASLVKSVRRGIASLLVVLLAAVLYHFVFRRHRAAAPGREQAIPEARQVDLKEGIRHREYKEGKVWVEVSADRFFLGPDGRDHLEGAVEVVDRGRADGRVVRITAERAAYDKEMVHFTVSGRVRATGGGFSFECEALDYDKDLVSYRAAKGGTFSSDRLAGSGGAFEYSERTDELRARGGFRLEVKPDPASAASATLSGDSLDYLRGEKKGRAEGAVRLVSADGEGRAAAVSFELTEDERFLRSADFEKGGRSLFKGGGGAGSRTVEAGTIRIVSFPGSSRIARVEAEGDARLTLEAPPEPAGDVEAQAIKLIFDPQGKVEGWTAAGGALMHVLKEPPETYEFAGETVSYSGPSGLLTVLAKDGETARLESSSARIEAPTISLAAGPDEAAASGGARCVLKPRPEGTAVGFFSKDAAVFAACRVLKTSGRDRVFHFEGDVRVWQGGRSVQAGEMDVREGSGEVRASGVVEAGFPRPAKDGSGESRIEAGGKEMEFSPSHGVVSFRGRSFVKLPDARLAADTVAIALSGEKNEVRDLVARGGVAFVWGRYEGRGGEARYDPQAETLVLTGEPVLAEKGGGESRGDKLTFRLGDDKILIENKGQGRSITVVKS